MRHTFLVTAGFIFSMLNTLPIPWLLRLFWMKCLYSFIAKATLFFPFILKWTLAQNEVYAMGKQHGEEYESLVQMERVLEQLEAKGVAPTAIQQALEQAEANGVPYEAFSSYIAREVLDPKTAEQVLITSLDSVRY